MAAESLKKRRPSYEKNIKMEACSGTQRLNKGSFLALLGDKKFQQQPLATQTIQDVSMQDVQSALEQTGNNFRATANMLGITLSTLQSKIKSWQTAIIPNLEDQSSSLTRRYFEKLKVPWSVISFNSSTREACVNINSPSGTTHLVVTVPSQKT